MTLVVHPDGEDWLWRPVVRGLCRAESLADGSLDLTDFARMNDALDIDAENQRRVQAAAENKPHGR